jgi:hypothetical protein
MCNVYLLANATLQKDANFLTMQDEILTITLILVLVSLYL